MSPETLGIVLIAAFGAAGAVARHAVTTAARRPGDGFPWGMLAVNLSGSAAAGAVAAAALAGPAAAEPPLVWAALGTGFLGAYTTASAVALQTLALLRAGAVARAAWSLGGSAGGAVAAAALGWRAARAVIGG